MNQAHCASYGMSQAHSAFQMPSYIQYVLGTWCLNTVCMKQMVSHTVCLRHIVPSYNMYETETYCALYNMYQAQCAS